MNKLTVEEIAEICHEANRLYCQTIGQAEWQTKSWDRVNESVRQSAIAGVQAKMDDPELTPAEQHENWMSYKINDGWVYGEEKHDGKKTHPCLVEYEKLPDTQKRKDLLFGSIVTALSMQVSW